MKQAHRFSGEGRAYHGLTKLTKAGPQWTGQVRCVDEALTEPLRWRKPVRVFVNSMSDLFHEDVPDVFIERVFSVMALAERHTFQVLTKRPQRMREWFRARRFDVKGYAILQTENADECRYAHPWPLPNVWLGVSVENQPCADERIPWLLETPAMIRFVSYEPALDYVNFRRWRNALDWIIFGLESGAHARSGDADWGRDLIAACVGARAKPFIKQLGAQGFDSARTASGRSESLNLRDKKGGDPAEWSADLRVREFPTQRCIT